MATKITRALAAIVLVAPLAFISCGGDDPTQDVNNTTPTEETVEMTQYHAASAVPGAASARYRIPPRQVETAVPHPICPTCPQGIGQLGVENVR